MPSSRSSIVADLVDLMEADPSRARLAPTIDQAQASVRRPHFTTRLERLVRYTHETGNEAGRNPGRQFSHCTFRSARPQNPATFATVSTTSEDGSLPRYPSEPVGHSALADSTISAAPAIVGSASPSALSLLLRKTSYIGDTRA